MYALPLSAVWLCTCVRCYVSAAGHGVLFLFSLVSLKINGPK